LNAVKFHDFWVSVKDKLDATSIDAPIGETVESGHCTADVDHEASVLVDANDDEASDATSNCVQPSLPDSDLAEGMRRAELMVTANFRYAGACARYMFSVHTADVMLLIDYGISMLGQPGDLIAGDRDKTAIKRHYGCYRNPYGQKYRIFVSEYAETQTALTLGPELVKILFSAVQDDCSGLKTLSLKLFSS
jgi:hypothetical protein